MQAEDIIQQKEWLALNAEEHGIIQPLAADEQEFNLLKQMLLLAKEDMTATPSISPDVPSALHDAMRQASRSYKTWSYAAAALLLLALAAWFILREGETPEAGTITGEWNTARYDSIARKDMVREESPASPLVEDKKPSLIVRRPAKSSSDSIRPMYAAVSTLVKNDTALMAFITEAY